MKKITSGFLRAIHCIAVIVAAAIIGLSLFGCDTDKGSGSGNGNKQPVPFIASQVVAGLNFTVAIREDGSLWAWGGNGGRFGDGTNENSNVPIRIGTETNWASISAGSSHTVAVKTDSSLWAWGWNGHGQLGDGTGGGGNSDKSGDKNIPTRIGTETNWASVSACDRHTMAIKTDGSLWAWGENRGNFGNGSTYEAVQDSNIPVQIGAETNWASVSAGSSHTMAIKTDGSLWAWGFNDDGQLGDGTEEYKYIPTLIGTEIDWASVSAGSYHTMAIKTDGSLWAWGFNGSGQLGDGTIVGKNIPTRIGIETNWASVSASSWYTMAIKQDGSLWAWGDNQHGEFGDGKNSPHSNIPKQIGTETNWVTVVAALANYYTFATKDNGSLWAWGTNWFGQLGDGTGGGGLDDTSGDKNSPTQVFIIK